MSCSYADGLSPYENKGQLGLEEKFDSVETLRIKCDLLADWIGGARHVVVHTGAGISTAAGIPDFRGPNGVWTLEEKGLKPEMSTSFDDAIPTKTHMALKKLLDSNKVKYIVSQNIDGLHLRSGVERQKLSELHGNMFVEQCDKCGRQFIRNFATKSVGKKSLGTVCRSEQIGGRPCRGKVHDTILDWEHNLPDNDLTLSDLHSSVADLSICLGTTLQIIPSGNLPLYTKKYGGRLVVCNLQPTKHDKKADLVINGMVDDIIVLVMKKLGLEIPDYDSELDPTRNSDMTSKDMDWTIPTARVKEMKILYKKVCKPTQRKRKTYMYERDREEFMKTVKKEKTAIAANRTLEAEIMHRIANTDPMMGYSGSVVNAKKVKVEKVDKGSKIDEETLDKELKVKEKKEKNLDKELKVKHDNLDRSLKVNEKNSGEESDVEEKNLEKELKVKGTINLDKNLQVKAEKIDEQSSVEEEDINKGLQIKGEAIDETSQSSEIINNEGSTSDKESPDRGGTDNETTDRIQELPSDEKTLVI